MLLIYFSLHHQQWHQSPPIAAYFRLDPTPMRNYSQPAEKENTIQ